MYLIDALRKYHQKSSYADQGALQQTTTRPPPPGIDLMVDTHPSFSGVAVAPTPVSASHGNLRFQSRDPRGDPVYTHGPANMPLPIPILASDTDVLYNKLQQ